MPAGKKKCITTLTNEIQKEYASTDIISTAYSLRDENIARIPFGIFALDLLTGGGIPLWRYTIFHGKKSSGKTSIALRVINNYLNLYKNSYAVYADFEHALDMAWLQNYVTPENLERLVIIRPAYGEEGADILVKIANEATDVGLICIDSLATIIPAKEVESSTMDETYALQARLIAKLLRKLIPPLAYAWRDNKRPLCYLIINQTRENLKAKAFQSTMIKPGGVLQDFIAGLDIRFYHKEYQKEGDIPIAGVYQFTIEKSKITGCFTKRSGEYTLTLIPHEDYKVGDIKDELDVVLNYAKKAGLILREGKTWVVGKNKTFGSILEMQNFFKTDIDSFVKLREKTLEISLNNIFFKEIEQVDD